MQFVIGLIVGLIVGGVTGVCTVSLAVASRDEYPVSTSDIQMHVNQNQLNQDKTADM